jgi:hypothetical protein
VALNGYLDFPHVGQAFMVERITFNKKTAKQSLTPPMASPVKHQTWPAPRKSCVTTANTGASRTVAITSSTGTTMKIAAAFAKVMVRKT